MSRRQRRLASVLLRPATLITAGCAVIATASPPQPPATPLRVGSGERLLVIAPHPDDEILGTAGLIQRVREHAGRVDVVLVTVRICATSSSA
jgi:hypothetical protein